MKTKMLAVMFLLTACSGTASYEPEDCDGCDAAQCDAPIPDAGVCSDEVRIYTWCTTSACDGLGGACLRSCVDLCHETMLACVQAGDQSAQWQFDQEGCESSAASAECKPFHCDTHD